VNRRVGIWPLAASPERAWPILWCCRGASQPIVGWGQAQSELRQSVEQKYEQYRTAIKNEHQIDIKNFKDRIPEGVADGKPITNYDLQQLLLGIKWESRIQRRKYARDPIQHRTYDLTHASLRDCRTGHAGWCMRFVVWSH